MSLNRITLFLKSLAQGLNGLGLVTGVMLVFTPIQVLASEESAIDCTDFSDNPSLYEECMAKQLDPEVQQSATEIEQGGIEPCYCDIRKQQQFEARKRRKEAIENGNASNE